MTPFFQDTSLGFLSVSHHSLHWVSARGQRIFSKTAYPETQCFNSSQYSTTRPDPRHVLWGHQQNVTAVLTRLSLLTTVHSTFQYAFSRSSKADSADGGPSKARRHSHPWSRPVTFSFSPSDVYTHIDEEGGLGIRPDKIKPRKKSAGAE
jgi:hypothetical protein